MKKSIVLCADDFGQAPAISQGILALVKESRLTAVSCMVNTSFWPEHSTWVIPYQGQIDLGLHFNLTEGKPLSQHLLSAFGPVLPSLRVLLYRAFLRKLNQRAIESEFHAQLDEFEKALGRLPQFIDGHQHVHQFPVIRSALMNVYKKRLRKDTTIRLLNERFKIRNVQDLKKIIIYLTGTKALKNLLDKQSVPYNSSFSGIYSFKKPKRYEEIFPEFLQEIGDKGLIMCHPGLSSANHTDCIAEARFKEYQYFSSPGFIKDCEKHHVVLARLD